MSDTAGPSPAGTKESPANDRLDSWKEIAAYLKREVRTAQRWEKTEGLPVHRHQHEKQGTVYAFKSEIDAWWKERRPRLEQQNEPPESAESEVAEATTEEVRRPATIHPWKGTAVIAAVLVVAAIVVGYLLRPRPPSVTAGKIMLAVLPFQNLSGDEGQKYFSEGLTDEMITQLGRLQPERLGVIARSSSMIYENSPKPVGEIGRELGVQYILEGAVRKDSNHVRITAQLIQVSDQTHAWAETYDRDLQDILKLQAEVAKAIANQIQVKLTLALGIPPAVNSEAYEAYLKGRFYWYRRDLPRSIDYYNQAIARDPGYALAYAGLAQAYVLLGSVPTAVLPPRRARPRAKDAASRAVKLDPKLDEAHLSLANTYLSYDWDWAAAEREFKKALELNPSNPTAHQWYAQYLVVQGRAQEAVVEAQHARQLDPLAEIINSSYAEAYYYSREYDKAIEQCRRTLELYPNSLYVLYWLGSSYREKKMYPEAIAAFSKARTASGNNPGMIAVLGHAYAVSGDRAEALKALGELQNLSTSRYIPALYIAAIYIGLADKDNAFQWLDRAYAERTDRLVYLVAEPPLSDPLRGDPRFRDLARRIGLNLRPSP